MRSENVILSNAHLRFHWKGETKAENHFIELVIIMLKYLSAKKMFSRKMRRRSTLRIV